MRKSFILANLFMWITFLLNAKSIPLTDAVQNGWVTLTAEGGHTGKSLKLKIENLRKKTIELQIPAGLIFNSNKDTEQDLMTTQERLLFGRSDRLWTNDFL